MTRISTHRPTTHTDETNYPPLRQLLSHSEDDFYGRLQRIWNNVLQLEDMGLIHDENDKFKYAYQFAEAELQRVCAERDEATALQLA